MLQGIDQKNHFYSFQLYDSDVINFSFFPNIIKALSNAFKYLHNL